MKSTELVYDCNFIPMSVIEILQRSIVSDISSDMRLLEVLFLKLKYPNIITKSDRKGFLTIFKEKDKIFLKSLYLFLNNEQELDGFMLLKSLNGLKFKDLTIYDENIIMNQVLQVVVFSPKTEDSFIKYYCNLIF